MKVHNHIFNRKMLNKQLDNFNLKDIPNLQEILTTIKKWKYSLEHSNLDKTKEETLQGDFLNHFFTKVLGYKNRYGNNLWNISQEQKTTVDGTKADGALGFFTPDINDIRVVIELKDAKTNLDEKQRGRTNRLSPVEQAFAYSSKSGKKCNWVIVSNFNEIRLYNSLSQGEYEKFYVTDLVEEEEFKRFYFLFNYSNLINRDGKSLIDKLFEKNEEEQIKISKDFYKDYKKVRIELFEHLKSNNPNQSELLLFEKSQKIMDRFIFVCFCEDSGLLPEKVFRNVIKSAINTFDMSNTRIWTQLKFLFASIDKGNEYQNINKFNGGLFKVDEELDCLVITDDIFPELEKISEYDFGSDLNVNILGHIFEQSISDIEEIKADIMGESTSNKKGKRKKDGIYYTPEYITKYIVEGSIGGWLAEKRSELGEDKLPPIPEPKKGMNASEKGARTKAIKKHLSFWEEYRNILANIKVLDPACGSGAFLNQAFDFLYNEGQKVNEVIYDLEGGQAQLFDLHKHILSNNLYGVDLNNESVEITKLSLWLKTANKYQELTTLDDNIKCGNSLIDDESIVREDAFKWEEGFKEMIEQGGFDVIIGNPPYVRQELINHYKPYLQEHYQSYSGRSDLYVYFFEKSINLLQEKGKLGFITSSKYIKANYGKSLRKFILDNSVIEEFVDFGDKNIFEGITAYPSIIMLSKETNVKQREKNVISYCNANKQSFNSSQINNFIGENNSLISQSRLNENEWTFKSDKYMDLLEKIKKRNSNFQDVLQKPKVGFKTGLNSAFTLSQEEANSLIEEDESSKEIIRPILFGENVKDYYVDTNYYTIFPYTESKDGLELINIDSYPAIKEHLEKYRDKLENRAIIKDGLKKGTKAWFEYQQVNKKFSLNENYIVYPNVALNNRFSITDSNVIDMTAFYIKIEKEQEAYLPILNSELYELLIKNIAIERRGGFREYKTQYIVQLPIPQLNRAEKEKFNSMSHKIERLKQQFLEENEKGLRLINDEYNLKMDKGLSRFKWEDVKKLAKGLSISEKEELYYWIDNKKEKINKIENEIEILKEELNKSVYELFNLNDEEIKLLKDSSRD